MKRVLLFMPGLLCCTLVFAQEQKGGRQIQYEVAAGLHSFYAPIKQLKWQNPGAMTALSVNRLFGQKQSVAVSLGLVFAFDQFQGNNLAIQLLGQYTPVVADRIELAVGTGIGYRFGLYPSKPLVFEQGSWTTGSPFKGMLQIPARLGVGYRSFTFSQYELRPYIAAELHAILGYSPDLSLLPVTNLMMGIKIQKSR